MSPIRDILFFFGLTLSLIESCSNGGYPVPNDNVCVYLNADQQYYIDTIRHCATLGSDGIPAKIKNIYENAYIYALLPTILGANDGAYIGLERKANNLWYYADGSPVTYMNWATGEPKNSSSLCAIMDPQTGKWISADCSVARPYVCSLIEVNTSTSVQPTKVNPTSGPIGPGGCPNGWTYFAANDDCYYVQNFTYTDGVHWQLYGAGTAEGKCEAMGANLVSIHSKGEDGFVYDLITSNVSRMKNVTTDDSPCGHQYAWIGYHGNGKGQGNWTDGSPVDYLGDNAKFFRNIKQYWMLANDDSCGMHAWYGSTDIATPARFVCKKPSSRIR
ncbi:unnamed protein product, partial [Mesorhabditis belari]|uniref:C-type lectin domain-containing protein n=1 Tax=Mesorhabditis belari TaxID=2138241 RepID=A0AAF3EUV4_9BILA